MDYLKIYNNLMYRAKNRTIPKESYCERHHILPKCLGGNNNKDNVVKLYPKEHYIAHLLLFTLHPNNQSLAFAFWMMCNGSKKERTYKISGKIYEEIRSRFIEIVKQRKPFFKGKKHSEESKLKISNAKLGQKTWLGKKHSEESKLKMSKSAIGKKITDETKKKMSDFWKGKVKSDETKKKMSESAKGENNNYKRYLERTGLPHVNSKTVLQYTLDGKLIKEWVNASVVSKELGLSYKAINQCLSGKNKTSQGFVWKYK